MIITVNIPKLSIATDEATPIEWLVSNGQRVAEGEPLFVVETEKVESEIPAPGSGIVQWEAELNQAYPVGTRIGRIEAGG